MKMYTYYFLCRVHTYIDDAEKSGAIILLDGRSWSKKMNPGFWIGPTIILHKNQSDRALNEEIFGPVLSVYHVDTWEEAIRMENR